MIRLITHTNACGVPECGQARQTLVPPGFNGRRPARAIGSSPASVRFGALFAPGPQGKCKRLRRVDSILETTATNCRHQSPARRESCPAGLQVECTIPASQRNQGLPAARATGASSRRCEARAHTLWNHAGQCAHRIASLLGLATAMPDSGTVG